MKRYSFNSTRSRRLSSSSGISLIETLIVIAMLALLFIIAMRYLGTSNLQKGRDATRKDDLHDIKIAFEEYYSDNGCYPPADILVNCGGTELSPYLSSIPCEPNTEDPYIYVPFPSYDDACSGYRVYTPLEWKGDPVIEELACTGGCGLMEEHLTYYGADGWNLEDYVYGISEGVPVAYSEGDPGLTSGYCCEVDGEDCQVWQWSVDSPGCTRYGPYVSVDACYAGPGNCQPN